MQIAAPDQVVLSFHTGHQTGNGWTVDWFNSTPSVSAQMRAVATCAALVPPT